MPGAHRAGIKNIIIPKGNEADFEDVPEEVRKTEDRTRGGGAGEQSRPLEMKEVA